MVVDVCREAECPSSCAVLCHLAMIHRVGGDAIPASAKKSPFISFCHLSVMLNLCRLISGEGAAARSVCFYFNSLCNRKYCGSADVPRTYSTVTDCILVIFPLRIIGLQLALLNYAAFLFLHWGLVPFRRHLPVVRISSLPSPIFFHILCSNVK